MYDKPTHADLGPLPSTLLQSVLEYTDRSTQVSCARVCKGWHEVVISVLWYRVDDIGRLLRVFRVNGAQPYIIPGACWTRVFHYANHIKELTVGPDGLGNLLESIIPSIRLHSLYLTPNLESLCWQSHQLLQYSLLFLPPCLSSLSIDGCDSFDPKNDICPLIQAIMERCPNMTSFDCSWPHNNDSAHAMIELISDRREPSMTRQWRIDAMGFGDTVFNISSESRLVGLGGVSRGSFAMFQTSGKLDQHPTSKYAGSLANLMDLKSSPTFSRLREIYLELCPEQANGQTVFPPGSMGQMLHGMTLQQPPTLQQTITLQQQLAIMAQQVNTLRQRYPPANVDYSSSLNSLCTAIADSACQVEIIAISSSRLSGVTSILFHTFEPLLRCRSLTTFVIMTPSPVLISDPNLESLAKAWPCLQHLYLSPLAAVPAPQYNLPPNNNPRLPSLGVICSLPMYCPNLHSLSLLVTPHTGWKACLQPFPQLKSLYLSFSGGEWNDAEVASTIVEATLDSCTILLHASGESPAQMEPFAQHAESVRRVQQDITYWRSMRNRCLEAIIVE